jgi:hypothetical protein
VREARVNLARWRDAEHDRRRRDIEPDEVAPDAPLPSVSGYFAVIGDRRNPGGIVRGTWKLGWPFEADYVRSYSICGAQARPVDPDVDEIVYLGETALPEFDALDAALGDVSARTIVGRALPEGVAAPAWESPPGASDFGRHYPPRASANSIAGDATLNCLVQDDLSLRCAVASEEPAGYGFGQAALRVLRSARVVASLPDGQSSAGLCISRTVRFRF